MTAPQPDLKTLVARALYGIREAATIDGWKHECFDDLNGERRRTWHDLAGRAVAALKDAGLLLPPGGETREDRNRYSERVGEGPWREVHAVRQITTWPDGSQLTGPWIEVPT